MNVFFTEEKLKMQLDMLEPYRLRDARQAKNMTSTPCPADTVNPQPPVEANWEPVTLGQQWSGRDSYLWLRCELELPEQWQGRQIVGKFDFGKTGSCNCSGFEALLYVDGKIYQGVDTHHSEVFFPRQWAGRTIRAEFRIWSGLEGGGLPQPQNHVFRTALSAWLDEPTDHLYCLGSMILQAAATMDANHALRARLLDALSQAFWHIDWAQAGTETFYAAVSAAYDRLNDAVAALEKHADVHLTCVGHTHIDVAWLWRYKHTREKAARSFATVLRLMELYPEYTFLQSQPQLYAYILQDFPELFEQIRDRVKEGRWEIDGGMWLEADCNIPSGESLTRQFLVGQQFVQKEFGKTMQYLWLPDVFGYSWALPQILKKSGIDTFVTTKISWNECNQMPYDTFTWVGIDGSRVLAHFITTPAASEEQGTWYYTYNGEMVPSAATGIWNNYKNKDLTNELLMAYGYGDGGGGVNREELEQRRMMDRIPGLPSITPGNAGEYFRRLHRQVEQKQGFFPEWDGELYLENHRGTYTSQAYNKYKNRRLEFTYRDTELLAVMARLQGKLDADAARDRLTEGWKIILRNQFHDVIPGSAIREANVDTRLEYDEAQAIADEIGLRAMDSLKHSDTGFTLLNTGSWDYESLAELPGVYDAVADADGNCLASQIYDGKTFIRCRISALASHNVYPAQGELQAAPSPFRFDGKTLETPFYRISFNAKGQMVSIYDLENEREILPVRQQANVLQFFEDRPFMCDAWNINLYYQEKVYEVDQLTKFQVEADGALCFVLGLAWEYRDSQIEQKLLFYADSRRIDFRTTVQMHENHLLLKVAFPADIRTTFATYDIQYGNVRRANNWNTSWDMAKFETVLHKWVDLSDADYGVSLLNDCKYGCDVHNNVMRLTLLKSATYPDYLQDQGEHHFTYSLYPHAGDVHHCATEKEAFYLNNPIRVYAGSHLPMELLGIAGDCAALDAVKWAEDDSGIILRLHEYKGARGKLILTPRFAWSGYCETNLMEKPLEALRAPTEKVTLEFTPFEVKTLLFRLP